MDRTISDSQPTVKRFVDGHWVGCRMKPYPGNRSESVQEASSRNQSRNVGYAFLILAVKNDDEIRAIGVTL